MKHASSPQAFSIVFALGITLLLCFMGLYLLEYMVPYSRNVKGIEFASQAFYESYAGVEDAVYEYNQAYAGNPGDEVQDPMSGDQDYSYQSTASGMLIPLQGKGDSEYHPDWNKLSQTQPIQLLVGNNRLNSGVNRIQFSLQIPDLNRNGGNDERLKTADNDADMILWQLSSTGAALSTRSGSFIKESHINSGFSNVSLWSGGFSNGTTLLNSNLTFSSFYASSCGVGSECVLKISLIAPLISQSSNTRFPYLEYKIQTTSSIPLREADILVQGKSYGFLKKLRVKIPQLTTNSAFDFTVFQ